MILRQFINNNVKVHVINFWYEIWGGRNYRIQNEIQIMQILRYLEKGRGGIVLLGDNDRVVCE